jgi:hypothetical protein
VIAAERTGRRCYGLEFDLLHADTAIRRCQDKLKTLYFAFYDPRIPFKDFFYLTVKRKDVQEQVTEYLEYQRRTIEEVNRIVNSLSF